MTHDLAAITAAVLDEYTLPTGGYHGVAHWARVLQNGLRVADVTGADREVVSLFALFHDSRRVNEHREPTTVCGAATLPGPCGEDAHPSG